MGEGIRAMALSRTTPAVSRSRLEDLVHARVHRAELAAQAAAARVRREFAGTDGRLFIVAADFTGRGILSAGRDDLALARRIDVLERILQALAEGSVDGVLATPDIIDDLLFIEAITLERGLPGRLDGRLLIGSVNRGGIVGTAFELDDTNTGYSIAGALERGLDGVKVMVRIAPDAPASGATLSRAAEVVREASRHRLPVFVETFPVRREKDHWAAVSDAKELARTVAIASALGDDSTCTWLKIPYCENFGLVAGATSCPITILGGDPAREAQDISETVICALAAGSNVRGAVIGRRALFPMRGDVSDACRRIGAAVHQSGEHRTHAE